MIKVKTKIGKILRDRGIKQKWIAEKLSVSETTVSNWVQGRHKPDPMSVYEFCKLMGLEVKDYLKVESENEES